MKCFCCHAYPRGRNSNNNKILRPDIAHAQTINNNAPKLDCNCFVFCNDLCTSTLYSMILQSFAFHNLRINNMQTS